MCHLLPWPLTSIWFSSLFPNSLSLSGFSFYGEFYGDFCLHSSLSSLVLTIFAGLLLVSLSSCDLYSLLPLLTEAFRGEWIFQQTSLTLWLKWRKPTITRMFSLCGVQKAHRRCEWKQLGDGTPNLRRCTDASQPIFRSQEPLRNPVESQRQQTRY